MNVSMLFATVIGALAGFAFHRLVGCRTGSCAIWSNPIIASVYGAVLGFVIGTGI